MKTLWNKILWVGSAILFIFVAIVLITTGRGSQIEHAFNAMVNKNRGRQDEIKDREADVVKVIDTAKEDLEDIRDRGDALEKKIEARDTRDHNEIIDDFQARYGN